MQIRVDTRELRQTARQLQRVSGGKLGDDARQGLVRAAGPVKRQVQAAARAVVVGSSRGGTARPDNSTDLRRRVADAVDTTPTRAGVAFTIAGYRIGVKGTKLAQLLDTEDEPVWRHPVFGNRARWEVQTGQPYFYVVIRAAEPEFAAAVEQAVNRFAQEATR